MKNQVTCRASPIALHWPGRGLGWIDAVVGFVIWAVIQCRDVAMSTPGPGRLEVIHCDGDEPFCARLRISLARLAGQALDNALMESTIGLYKTELIDRALSWSGRAEVERETADWVRWFNADRLHSSIDYLSPSEYETR